MLSARTTPAIAPSTSRLAPIALFVFKRPAHTFKTLQALSRNPEFMDSPLHVFCDGARRPGEADEVGKVRHIVRDFAHPNKRVHETASNRGLGPSVIAGVTTLCEEHGRVIVVEDDLLVARDFLQYMNLALDRYANEPKVMQIAGYMFPVDLGDSGDSVMLPFTTSWGWATWQRAWAAFDASASGATQIGRNLAQRVRFDLDGSYPYFRMLQQQLAGEVDSWAIRWYLSVYLRRGLTLYPRISLVENIGFDGSGTHCADVGEGATALASGVCPRVTANSATEVDAPAFERVKAFLRGQRGVYGRLRDWRSRLLPAGLPGGERAL